MRAIGPHAQTHGTHEIRFSPSSQARSRVRCDVRPVERSERRLQRPSARVGRRVFLRVRVTANAACRLRDVRTALCITLRESAAVRS